MSLTKVTNSMIEGSYVNVLDYGADSSGSTDSTSAFQNALDTGLIVYVPDGSYNTNALVFVAGNMLLGQSRQNTIIDYTGSTTFITGGADLNRVGLENLRVTASNTPSGYGVFFDLSTVRQPRFVNVAITGFDNGIRIDDALNGWVEQVYLGGNGSAVSGSVGLQFGESAGQSGTTWQANNVYITGFQYGVKHWATASMYNTLIIELCSVGFYSQAPCTVVSPWFDTVVTEFDLYLNGICIIGPRWANSTPQIVADSVATKKRTTIIPATGDVNPTTAPSWKMGTLNVWSGGQIQHDYLQGNYSANYNFSIRPTADYSHGIERRKDAGTGYNYSLRAGGALAGETNTDAGYLELRPGTATGSGRGSTYLFWTGGGASGTADNDGAAGVIMHWSGNFLPATDNVRSCGDATHRWTEIFAVSGTINTSDEREKTFLTIEDAERAAALEIKANMRKFKFNDAIKLKGDSARIHYGVSAQQIGNIMQSHGLDPNAYGFFCHDTWEDQAAVINDNGETLEEAVVAGDKYGIRYDELLCFIIAAI